MSYLKRTVDRQRYLLIHKLVQAGILNQEDPAIYHKSMTELVNVYQTSILNKEQDAI